MCQFIETIKIANGRARNLEGHNKRLNHTRKVHFGVDSTIDLRQYIYPRSFIYGGLNKCRILYDRVIQKIEFRPYVFKNPRRFKLVHADHLDYTFKYANRSALHKLFLTRAAADDIIIVKNGFLTDTYYANIALLKNGVWFTPQTTLLNGTQRQYLINRAVLLETPVPVNHIYDFQAIKIINAMTGWDMHQPVQINRKSIF